MVGGSGSPEASPRDTPKTVARLVMGDEATSTAEGRMSPAHEQSSSSENGLSPEAREKKKQAARKSVNALYDSAVKKEEAKKKAEMDKKSEQEVQRQEEAKRKELLAQKSKAISTEMAKKRTSQGDFVTRLTMDAITKKERIAKLEHEAREKEEVMLNQKSVHKNKVIDDSGLERLTQGSSQKDRDRRQKLQEQKEEQIREATQVKAFVSATSQKIVEKGLRDGSTLAERTQAMLERKRKAREEQQAREEQELKNRSKQTSLRSSVTSLPSPPATSPPTVGRQCSPSSRSRLRSSAKQTPRRARIITYGDSPPSSRRLTGSGDTAVGFASSASGSRELAASLDGPPVMLASDDKVQAMLAEQQGTIAERDAIIAEQRKQIDERDAIISELNKQLSAISLQIEHLQQQVKHDEDENVVGPGCAHDGDPCQEDDPSQESGGAQGTDEGAGNLAIISEIESQVHALAEKLQGMDKDKALAEVEACDI